MAPLLQEAGGHRWQRVPPNDRKGRVHTSTVTVAILSTDGPTIDDVCWSDVDMRFTKATGAGGQHRNKRDSCVVLLHRPTGLVATCDGRDQHANRRQAWAVLQQRVRAQRQQEVTSDLNTKRREMVGSGQRGDKVRTYRCQDDRVTDHRSGKAARLSAVVDGQLELLK